MEKNRTIAGVAESYGLVAQTVGVWVRNYRKEHPDPGIVISTETESKELARTSKELREARMEIEFLKKAAAFFARESQ